MNQCGAGAPKPFKGQKDKQKTPSMKMIHSYQGGINYEVLKSIMASNMQEDVIPRPWKSKKWTN